MQIKCELCGSNDLVKKDDYFVCQYCGCKYTVEQAKKMIIEGVVTVEGKVEVDNKKKLENLYENARRAKETNDYENAKKYYTLILDEDSKSFEALFYIAYFEAYYCANKDLKYRAIKLYNCVKEVATLINQSDLSLQEKAQSYLMIGNSITIISIGLQDRAKKFRNQMLGTKGFLSPLRLMSAPKDLNEYQDTVIPLVNCQLNFASKLEEVISSYTDFPAVKNLMIKMWENGVKDLKDLFKGRGMNKQNKEVINLYEKKIATYKK